MISYTHKKTVKDFHWFNKIALIRCDFNVPIDLESFKILDDTRIVKALITINYIIKNGGKIILMSHLGRVKKVSDVRKYSLVRVAAHLQKLLLNRNVIFISETRGEKLNKAVRELKKGEIILLENTRFEDLNNQAESNCCPELSQYWAQLADIFVNDAFGTIHRRHASTYGVAKYSNNTCVGLLVEEEIFNLEKVIFSPTRPLLAIIGGAKVSDKIQVIENLLRIVDYLILGGGMVFTFNLARGIPIGKSICEIIQVEKAKKLLALFPNKIILPCDFLTAPAFQNLPPLITPNSKIASDQYGLDIGPQSIKKYQEIIAKCHSIIWNGPLGVCEFSNYTNGTHAVCEAISNLRDVYSIVGGGDSIAAIRKLGYIQNVSHISTGGGAMLMYFAGQKLASLEIIENQ